MHLHSQFFFVGIPLLPPSHPMLLFSHFLSIHKKKNREFKINVFFNRILSNDTIFFVCIFFKFYLFVLSLVLLRLANNNSFESEVHICNVKQADFMEIIFPLEVLMIFFSYIFCLAFGLDEW